jgi:sugar phosphate isomerase/epimerase
MARAVVCHGTPQNLEEREFTYSRGRRAGEQGRSLSFRLQSSAIAMLGSSQFETSDPDVITAIEQAADMGQPVFVVCTPRAIRHERDGEPADWVKLIAGAVIS